MTAEAIVADTVELQGVACGVTIGTAQVAVRTRQRKAVLLVQLRDVVHDPIHRGMAAHAVTSYAHPVHVRVARCAIHGRRVEDQRRMARLAIHFGMGPLQREVRGVVLEDHGRRSGIHQRLLHTRLTLVLHHRSFGFDPDERGVGPSRRTVALGAINGEVLAMRRLR